VTLAGRNVETAEPVAAEMRETRGARVMVEPLDLEETGVDTSRHSREEREPLHVWIRTRE